MKCARCSPVRQRGAVAVEFALIAMAFFTLLIGITAFGHWLWTLEAVTDATRTAARMAVVCDINDGAIKAAIQKRVPHLGLSSAQIALEYLPAGCNQGTCRIVRVSLSGATYSPWLAIAPGTFAIPPFTTSLPRESLESVNAAGEVNPVCI
jgi:hypothetical protein